jgi:hypothetical protein
MPQGPPKAAEHPKTAICPTRRAESGNGPRWGKIGLKNALQATGFSRPKNIIPRTKNYRYAIQEF